MAKTSSASPFQALEEEAYHAYREWPLWLVLRERELGAHLAQNSAPPGAAVSESTQKALVNAQHPDVQAT